MKFPHVRLVIERVNGRKSDIEIDGLRVTQSMLDAAEDLLALLTTGESPLLKSLYDACARAFGTTRADAKERLIAAMYGKRGAAPPEDLS